MRVCGRKATTHTGQLIGLDAWLQPFWRFSSFSRRLFAAAANPEFLNQRKLVAILR